MIIPNMLLLVVLFLTSRTQCMSEKSNTKPKLHILGLYPLTGMWPAGETILAASRMAVDHINRNASLLADYELVLIAANSECNAGAAIDVMYKELYNSSTVKLMILGPGCSLAAEPTAEASHKWNLMQISYSATSPELSQREFYPKFFRVCLSGVLYNAMRIALMRHFGWKQIATIYQRADVFTLIMADFRRRIEENGMKIVASEAFTDNPTSQLKLIKDSGVRIIYGDFFEPQARKVFCEAWKLKLYAPKYVWMIPGWFQNRWWLVKDEFEGLDCTESQMAKAVNGSFGVDAVALYKDSTYTDTISGLNAEEFSMQLKDYIDTDDVESAYGFGYSAYGYDTVWTAAVALHRADVYLKTMDQTKDISMFTYADDNVSAIIYNMMNLVNFNGITGPVKFSSSGDRKGLLSLTQNQNGSDVVVGICNLALPSSRQLHLHKAVTIVWQDGEVPVDSVMEITELQVISFGAFLLVVIISSLGITFAVLLMVFNCIYRNVRLIKMSSPRLNNMILLGTVLVYLSSIFQGIDINLVDTYIYLAMCKVYIWIFTIGFVLSFGSLFMKTWRVHRIFTTKSVMPKRISDVNLFVKVGMLILINVGVLTTWENVDPLVIKRDSSPSVETFNDDVIITQVYLSCSSYWNIYWLGALFIPNGILLIFGAFLSWETRNVTMPALNDSKQIGTSLYVVTVASFINVPVSVVIVSPSLHYVLVSLLTIVPTTIVLCLIFVPKIKSRNTVMPVTTMTGHDMSVTQAQGPSGNAQNVENMDHGQ